MIDGEWKMHFTAISRKYEDTFILHFCFGDKGEVVAAQLRSTTGGCGSRFGQWSR